MSSLMAAIQSGDLSTVQQLITEDPARLHAEENGVTPILMSVYYRQPAVTDFLLAHADHLSLFEAAAVGQTQTVAILLSQDSAQVNAYAGDGFTALGLAAYFGHEAVALLLLEHGADVNQAAHNAQKVAPLHSAVAGQHRAIVDLLLEHGADVQAAQEQGITALMAAAQHGDIPLVETLLVHGARIDARTTDRKTAADFAREAGHPEVVELLE
jgi:ankyrin repeat protein